MSGFWTVVSIAMGGLVVKDLNTQYKKYKGTYKPKAHIHTTYTKVPTGYRGWIKPKYKDIKETKIIYY